MPRTTLLADAGQPPGERWEYAEARSASDPSVVYTLRRLLPDGLWICDPACRGFAYRQHCRHTEEQEEKTARARQSVSQ